MSDVSLHRGHDPDEGKKRTRPAIAFAKRVLAGVASKLLVDLIHKLHDWMTS